MSNDTMNALLAESPVEIQVKGKTEVALTEKVTTEIGKAHVSRVRSFIKATLRDKALLAAFQGSEDFQERATEYFSFAYRGR